MEKVNVFSASFGPKELLLMGATMQLLVDKGIEFSVIDDRGGSSAWIIKIAPTSASKNILPRIQSVQWFENRELAIGV